MNEREKYELMWKEPLYRSGNGGLQHIEEFKRIANIQPGNVVVDFGCGEGKTLRPLTDAGAQVILIDIADNCLADDALQKSFLRHDLSKPLHLQADIGFCVDTMEHFPPVQIDDVFTNIFSIVNSCFFMVSTTNDKAGKLIGEMLHLTVEPYSWWKEKLSAHGEISLLNKNQNFFTVFVHGDS